MDDNVFGELISGDLERPISQTSTSADEPLDAALLDMFAIIPDF